MCQHFLENILADHTGLEPATTGFEDRDSSIELMAELWDGTKPTQVCYALYHLCDAISYACIRHVILQTWRGG